MAQFLDTDFAYRFMRVVVVLLSSLFLAACVGKATFDGIPATNKGQAPLLLVKDPIPQSIVVIGGTSGIGLELVKLALTRGHSVTAVSRRPERLSLTHPNLIKAKGDILSSADMTKVVSGNDVVVSTVGLAAGKRNVTLFSEGTRNLIAVMSQAGKERLIVVSAIGAGDSEGHGGFLFDAILQPLILGDDIRDKTRMEDLLIESMLDYTVVRPAILTDDFAKQQYRIFTDLKGIETGTIARQDVAHFILSIAEQKAYIKQIVTVSD